MGAFCELEKRGDIFFLTLTGEGENDHHGLNPAAIESVVSALGRARDECSSVSALITTARGKFFCNGLDLAWAQAAGSAAGFKDRLLSMVDSFKQIVTELISLPMPTIAAVNGHAAAAGFALALSHDYVLMRGDKGLLYMSELDIGMTFPDYFTALMRSKIGGRLRRDVMLRGRKMRGGEGVEMGIVDSVHDGAEAVVEAAVGLGEELGKRRWNGEVYGEIRKSLYPEICSVLGLSSRAVYAPRV